MQKLKVLSSVIQKHLGVWTIQAVNAGLNLWSFGVMSNFRDNPMMASNFWTNVNMLTTLLGIGLLAYSFFI
jgi:hypothetical protein